MLKQLLLLSSLLVFMFTVGSVVAQTPTELGSKYGSPVNAYVIRPGLLLTTKYAESGQVCEMSVIEAQTPGADITSRVPLTTEIVLKLIEELIPEGERGKKADSYGLLQAQLTTGQFSYDYEHV